MHRPAIGALTRMSLGIASLALLCAPPSLVAQPAGSEFRVNATTTNAQSQPAVASDSTGNFVVVWTSYGQDGAYEGVYGQRYGSAGVPVGPEFRVNTGTTGPQRYPAVSSDSNGNFVVVWASGNYAVVFGQRYSSAGAPLGSEFRVNASGSGRYPAVASDSTGDFVVVWQNGAGYGIHGLRFSSTGAPLGAGFRVDAASTDSLLAPKVASDSAGNFVVVWTDNGRDGYANGVFGQRFGSTGAPLGSEFQVNSFTTGSQLRPSVASDASGNFVVVWEDSARSGIFGQRYGSNGAPIGSEFRLDVGTTSRGRVSVASDALGNFVATWDFVESGGQNEGVFGRLYGSAGAPLGPGFHANSYTSTNEISPAVSSSSTGKFVVAWTRQSDGSSYGVFGQRYAGSTCAVGDANWDGAVNVGDVFYLINTLFAGGPAPVCSADVNADTKVDVSDVFYLINFLFAGGQPPQ